MKNTKIITLTLLGIILGVTSSLAGNKDRVGQSGADELRINPWAGSSGSGSVNMSNVNGLEAMHQNAAGVAFTNKLDIIYARTNWLSGSGINVNAFGMSTHLGESDGVLAFSVMSMGFGDIEVTTVNQPEGGNGVFRPQYMNLGLTYAKAYSNSIYGGFTAKVITQGIADTKAQGIAVDFGIRYVTGAKENMKFGIALRNVGPKMQYRGDGLSQKIILQGNEFTLEQRSEGFELPALLSIGGSYDFYIADRVDSVTKKTEAMHKLSVAGTFISNSFGKDQMGMGLEYTLMDMLTLRAGYQYEAGLLDVTTRTSVYTGPTMGASVSKAFGQSGSKIGVDYSYRLTNPFGGTHSIGLRINI